MSGGFTVKQFAAGSCYSYILHSQDAAVIIDPHVSLLEEYARYLTKKHLGIKYIIDTHTHADHFSLAAVLKKQYRSSVLMHEKSVSSVADGRLKDNEEIAFGASRCRAIYTPGHTDDSISIYGEGRLFTGDVMLIGSVGRTDFQNGSPEAMFDTLQRLKALPDETILYPAHDYNGNRSSTIAREKERNPFIRETSREAFVNNARSKRLPTPFNIDNIIRVNQRGEASHLKRISPEAARALVAGDPQVTLLDVRSASEFSEVHIEHSLNIPVDMLAARIEELGTQAKTYVVFCHSGTRSPMAADMLLQSGIHSVKVMDGGIARWQKERLPVIRGEAVISLERQVGIVAGSLVLIGILMANFVNGVFILIPLLVSCGLIFAGVTDNCLMGMLLMKLPYNRKMFRSKTGGGTCSISQ